MTSYMEIEAKDVKVDDKVIIDDNTYTVKKVEHSNIGKHGSSKVRLELLDDNGKRIVEILLMDDMVDKVE